MTATTTAGREWTAVSDHWAWYLQRGVNGREHSDRLVYLFDDRHWILTQGIPEGALPGEVMADLARGRPTAHIYARPLPEWANGMYAYVDGLSMITLDLEACGDDLADVFAHEVGHALDPVPLNGKEYRRYLAGTEHARAERAAEDYADRWRTPEQRAAARAEWSPEDRAAMYGDQEDAS